MGLYMHNRNALPLLVMLAIMAFSTLAPQRKAHAQEVRLRRADRLELSVPQRSELDRRLVVDNEGRVDIPIIGDFRIEGMLVAEAEEAILRALREIYPSVQRITLRLIGDEARRLVYIHGQVENPGRYEFLDNPNVWEAVREAGGATPQAALGSVRIIRAEGDAQRTFLVNLQQVLESGDFDSLPRLWPGDTVIIPERTDLHIGSGAVRVIGSVARPGPHGLGPDKTLIDAVLAAGGPTTGANLDRVKVIRRLRDGGRMTFTVNFRKYLDEGDARYNPLVYPDDTVHVPAQRSSPIASVITDPRFWLAVVTAYATVYAVLD